MKSFLRLAAVRKSYGAVQALKGVSFDLRPGEVHALVGENGAGKTTLVKLITGAERPEAGLLEIDGQHVDYLTPKHAKQLGIAGLYQQPALFPELTVAENIGLRLEPTTVLRRVDWAARRARAFQLLGRIGAEISPDAKVQDLSMPEQQLVELACVIGSNARIFIMDEPTASLTLKEQELLFALVRDLRQQGHGIIYISHRLEEVFALADRVTVLRDGESVGTIQANELNDAQLIRLMVGREINQLYPPRDCRPGKELLSLRDVGCSYSGVRNASLRVRAGEILGLAGLVGAGRTELARVLFGITPADQGELRWANRPVTIGSPQEAVALGIGYVPEDRARHGVILDLPVSQNTSLAVLPRLFPNAWIRAGSERQLALKSIKALGIKTAGPDALANSLSGGNQQKVSIARWLATKPKLLILDEPTQGVDVGAKSELHRIIRDLARQGLAVLLISSDLPEILGMSDRIAVMRHGTVVATFPPQTDPHDIMAAALGSSQRL